MPANRLLAGCRRLTAPVLLGFALSACAAAMPGYSPDPKMQEAEVKKAQAAAVAGRMQPDGSYALGAEEQALDCKKMAGRMQVRILQIRDYNERNRSTVIARTAQKANNFVFGGSTYSANPEADLARDRAMLEAYNKQLVAKGCQPFDLDAELKPKPIDETPRQIAKPAASKPSQ